ncbi:hypothetical protein SLA_0459 [Streptomyces laurentii]|uniref:Uncharacterized protein n=1 Tax=Streptomyces laurentii TaxID=39478 RepID=A0A160NU70_STRLU|nr:hypothetical protein SLA_0459 [Streptomyces laurentii]
MRQSAYAQVMRAGSCLLMAWQVWMVWYIASHEADAVEWSCSADDGCASDQLAAGAPVLGIASALALGLLSTRFLHRATPGVMVALSAFATVAGWRDALAEGQVTGDTVTSFHLFFPLGEFTVAAWLAFLWSVAGAGCVAAGWGAIVSLRRTAGLRRLSRRTSTADAVLEGWRSVGRGRGEVLVVFDDAAGVRHRVPAVVHRAALRRDVRAVFDTDRPGDQARIRVALRRRKVLSFT